MGRVEVRRNFTISANNREMVMRSLGLFLRSLELEKPVEVSVKESGASKTLAQLGALFGVWVEYVMDQTGYEKSEIHRMWKGMFLCRIYCEDPVGEEQNKWVDLFYHLQQKGDIEGMKKHAETISLRWARLRQMRKYMDDIQNYYISHGMPLPIPDRFAESYK